MNTPIDSFQQQHVSFIWVEREELPVHCPPAEATKWNMHPKVFLKFDANGEASCPYCGSNYHIA